MLVPVYDIINCGPRHRFSANGKLVHNSQGINLQNLTRGSRLRKAICAPPGYRIVVCDLSAIEARVNAWFSGQQDAVNIFAQNGDIYCVMAESIYGRRVTKADKAERRLGKTIILGCGYMMSWKRFYDYLLTQPDGAIIFGETELVQFGLSVGAFLANKKNAIFVKVNRPRHWDEHAFAIHCCVCEYVIRVYRTTNYAIAAQWKDCQRALADMVAGYERVVGAVDGVVYTAKDKLITPNNRILYPGLATKDGKEYTRRTRDGVSYVHGGLLTENCLAAHTLVLTERGFVPIVNIRISDKVWDGGQWVAHGGLLRQGMQFTISVFGTDCTHDHLLLTTNGWEEAQYAREESIFTAAHPRLNGASIRAVASNWLRRTRHSNSLGVLARYVFLWVGWCEVWEEPKQRWHQLMRVFDAGAGQCQSKNAWDVVTPSFRSVAQYARQVSFTIAQSIRTLWGQGHRGLQRMARVLRGVLGRHGADISAGADARQNKEQRRLQPDELQMGGAQGAGTQHQSQCQGTDAPRGDASLRSIGVIGAEHDDTVLQSRGRVGTGEIVRQTRPQEVFDIADAGPNHCFAILTNRGLMLAHNCVQHLSRQIMAEQTLEAVRCGLNVVFTCHDEIVCLEREAEAEVALKQLEKIMSTAPVWAPGLPVNCEGSHEYNYGDAK